MQSFKPIFIVGVGRSGTSMLQSMLNAHRDITFPPETHFIRNYMASNISLTDAREKLFMDKDLLKLGIPLESIFENSKNLNDFYTSLLITYMKKQNKSIVGDKDPKNIEYLKLIYSIFPDAIIIHIYRDPRAVIASRLKAEWSKDKPFWQHLLAYKSQLAYGQKIGKKLFEKYIEVKYENLIREPEKELRWLSEKIGINFDDNMIEFYKSASEVVQGKELSWKQNVFNPVMLENIDKWKKELSQDKVQMIEMMLSFEMQTLKYEQIEIISILYRIKKQLYKLFLNTTSLIYTTKLN